MTIARGSSSVMFPGSVIRRLDRWRVLLAHDTRAATCDTLVRSLEQVLPHLEIAFASSMEDACDALEEATFEAILVCLDLPPAPGAGVRLGRVVVRHRRPFVLVTRSLRWLPFDAAELRSMPWIQPDAGPEDVRRALLATRSDTSQPADEVKTSRAGSPPERMPSWRR